MPRNSFGVYTLPDVINPVVPATIIQASWANPTLEDIGNELTQSFPRNGSAGMTAAAKFADGTAPAPGVAFTGAANTGMFRNGTTLGFSSGGLQTFSVGPNSFAGMSAGVSYFSADTSNLTYRKSDGTVLFNIEAATGAVTGIGGTSLTRWANGTLADPGARFNSEATGLFLESAGKMHVGVLGTDMVVADNTDGTRFLYSGNGSNISLQNGTSPPSRFFTTAAGGVWLANGWKSGPGGNIAEATSGSSLQIQQSPVQLVYQAFSGATVGGAVSFNQVLMRGNPSDGMRFEYGGEGSPISVQRAGAGTIGRLVVNLSGGVFLVQGSRLNAAGNGWIVETSPGGLVGMSPAGGLVFNSLTGSVGAAATSTTWLDLNFSGQPQSGLKIRNGGYGGASGGASLAGMYNAVQAGGIDFQLLDGTPGTESGMAAIGTVKTGSFATRLTVDYPEITAASRIHINPTALASTLAQLRITGVSGQTNGARFSMSLPGISSWVCYVASANGNWYWQSTSNGETPTGNYITVDTSGNFSAIGNVSAFSDERLKKNMRRVRKVDLRGLKALRYLRKEKGVGSQIGVSAQALQKVLPECVTSISGELAVDYGRAALVLLLKYLDGDLVYGN